MLVLSTAPVWPIIFAARLKHAHNGIFAQAIRIKMDFLYCTEIVSEYGGAFILVFDAYNRVIA